MPRVSEDHLIARREQILVAARTCFLRNGLHNTTMQDLIAEAGLSVGAVYRYFKSKNEIINAIAESVAGGITALLQEVSTREPAPPLVEALSEVFDAINVQVGENGNFPLAVQVWGEATLDPAIREIVRHRYQGMREAYVTLARRAVERGELAPDTDVEAAASVLFGLIPGFALQRLFLGHPDKDTYLRGVRALLNPG
ncbi:TetR/AcrR family transcriptional regulator [Jidongwangia harbinensis]|uniref:TetR/AcrR family transcriptional regulator n=1 Tax=Jidongwangia harbinensis TaxID=2878561 RepID=UPI001CDA313D|nr:TetR/AcrR family transcriptional regulator [Jidongwangia harbinensis]MCA2213868.1 TetR/AcrR family transcriptional regulator [Jidongwangia harbinensis]